MILNYFNSYFEILVGINLGYASFEYFRTELKNKIFNFAIFPNFNEQEAVLTSQMSEIPEDHNKFEELRRVKQTIEIKKTSLELAEQRGQKFFEILKPISFILGLFCLTFLIIAGFQQKASCIDSPKYSEYILFLSCFTGVFIILIFFSSLSFRIIINNLKITFYQSTFSYIIFSLLSCSSVINSLTTHVFLKLIFILIVPIALFLIFTFRNLKKSNKYEWKGLRPALKEFFKYFVRNIKYLIYFLIVVTSGLIPIYLICELNFFNFLSFYIVLITPTLLIFFLYLRVLIHNRRYNKKYEELANEIATNLRFYFSVTPSSSSPTLQ